MPTVMLITVNTANVQPWEPRGPLLTSMCRAPVLAALTHVPGGALREQGCRRPTAPRSKLRFAELTSRPGFKARKGCWGHSHQGLKSAPPSPLLQLPCSGKRL